MSNAETNMPLSTPLTLIGRSGDDPQAPASKRAPVTEAARAKFGYTTGATGESEVTVHRSQGDLDRGGMILNFEVHNVEDSFLPTAKVTARGVELHIAGEAEAEAMVLALQTALMRLNADRARRVGVHGKES